MRFTKNLPLTDIIILVNSRVLGIASIKVGNYFTAVAVIITFLCHNNHYITTVFDK